MLKRTKKPLGIESLKRRTGRLFVLHWEIGLILFFIMPLISSLSYSFSELTFTGSGLEQKFHGLGYYKDLFVSDAQFLPNLNKSLVELSYSLPLILALSLILAIVLNNKFIGRSLARTVFFLPVVIATGVVMTEISKPGMGMSLFTSSSTGTEVYNSMINFDAILKDLKLPEELQKLFSIYCSNIFNLIWSCGIQIVLFLSGLQSIPSHLYEVSKVEGANAWDNFWYITLPMLSNVLLLVTIYTAIDLFTATDNPVIAQAYSLLKSQQIYDRSSAMLWAYFAIVGAVLALIYALYRRLCLKRWE